MWTNELFLKKVLTSLIMLLSVLRVIVHVELTMHL